MKNRNKKIIVYVLVLIGVLSLILTYKFKQNNLSKNKPIKEEKLSIMIKEDGAADYTKSSSKEIPKGNYVLNEEKTHCENNGQVTSYDNATGTVSFSFIGSDKCYLYFDYKSSKLFSEVVKVSSNLVSSQDGTSFEIDDENGIRYEGANPDNFICLDNQKEGACTDSSLLFRIIGLFDEEYSIDGTNSSGTKSLLKIIDTNNYGGDNGKKWTGEQIVFNSNNKNEIKPSFLKNTTKYNTKFLAGDVCMDYNDWSSSTLKEEINNEYLQSLEDNSNINNTLLNSILNVKWYLGASGLYNVTDVYQGERNESNIYPSNSSSIFAKVGLMYVSDYGYATIGGTTGKSTCRDDFSGTDCINNNWIFTSASFNHSGEWTIMPTSVGACEAYYLNSNGYIINTISIGNLLLSVRPTFYLDSENLKIVGGDGSSSNPYHIG